MTREPTIALEREITMSGARIACVASVLLFFVACANEPTGVRTAPEESSVAEPPDIPSIEWTDPHGTLAASLEEAKAELPFEPQVPKLGKADAISVIPGSDIAWVYTDPKIGQYYVDENIPTETQAQLEQAATCQPGETNCSTEGWSLQTIRKGTTALVIYAPEERSVATSVTWIEGGLEFTVMGPRSTMTEASALDVANNV
jgi:hypothetical protein